MLAVVSRLPFTTKYLYHLDSVNYALALRQYDLMLHQPQPPGYFLYIMLGRLARLFFADANTALVALSIICSALTVAVIYHLGKEMFDAGIGTVAALLVLVSPNFWFHGEVALNYPVEAFFSALAGLFCWRASQGRKPYILLSALVLAVAGGFRQNTAVFLLPLWLFSVRRGSWRAISSGIAVFGAACLAWFIPMALMTGGLDTYMASFGELWRFNTGHNSVFDKGLPFLKIHARALYNFIFFSMGAALPVLLLAVYAALRNRRLQAVDSGRAGFMALWTAPSLLFYLLVFIHPSNPGYILIVMPPLLLIAAASTAYLARELEGQTGKKLLPVLLCAMLLTNAGIFLFSRYPVSRFEIRKNDADLEALFSRLKTFDAGNTAVLVGGPYIFCGFRHIMYYLPEYLTYQVDVRISGTGEARKFLGGTGGRTLLVKDIRLPRGIVNFAAVYADDSCRFRDIPPGLSLDRIDKDFGIVHGPVDRATDLFPRLRPYFRFAPEGTSSGLPERSPATGPAREQGNTTRRGIPHGN